MLNKLSFLGILLLLLISCNSEEKQSADLLVFNAQIYTVDTTFSTTEAFVVKDGKFLETGTPEALQEKYDFKDKLDAEGKTTLPGFIDAHAHFYRMGMQQQKVDLTGTNSFKEVLDRIVAFQKERNVNFITGRGWDQNDWEVKEFPSKEKPVEAPEAPWGWE